MIDYTQFNNLFRTNMATGESIGGFGSQTTGMPVAQTPANIAGPGVTMQPISSAFQGIFNNGKTPEGAESLFGKIGGLEGLGSIANVLGAFGGIYGGLQGVSMARKQLDLSKRAFETNLANQTQSYNTTLEDKIRSRYATEGKSESAADAYLKKHSL